MTDRHLKRTPLSLKEYAEILGIVVAIVTGVGGLIQSNRALDLAQKAQDIVVNVGGNPVYDSTATFMPLQNPPDFAKDCIAGILQFDFDVQLDNLSERKVSIRSIQAHPLFDGTLFGMASIGPQPPWFRKTASGLSPDTFPVSLDAGESIDLVVKLGWPIDSTSYNAIAEYSASNPRNSLTFRDALFAVAAKGRSLGCSPVEHGKDYVIYTEPSKIRLGIDVTTSFDTHHYATVDIQ